ncbi:HAD hydrolase-like protein [Parapusillimonas sp. JC17]|uniref:HAD hydrolase-like protein n=1 Tax=Parapusillimonas sp. JC17 TaxID=3445768 RepID=UPI003F9F861C
MFDICLFDLDDTLLRTSDLKEIRESCKCNDDPDRLQMLREQLAEMDGRHIYSLALLQQIRTEFRKLRLGVFTRSPKSYALTVLGWAYPGLKWDVVVAYEDVRRTKPYGDGIDHAMETFGVEDLDRVILVGDTDADVRAGYHCGCVVALDRGAWPYSKESTHWNAERLVPDVLLDDPDDLLDVLRRPHAHLPELERLLAGGERPKRLRFDKINHFIPKVADGDRTAFPIYVAGRSFANYDSVQYRKQWHELTASIGENKEADVFPSEWVVAIRSFIDNHYLALFGVVRIVVSVVPHRPGRKARLENFLMQLEQSVREQPLEGFEIICQPELLGYKQGVKSQHNDHLNHTERFLNVRDHLFVNNPDQLAARTSYLIIDDVTTTGASLIYAGKYLKEAGAQEVTCLSMAKNIGNII